MMEREQVLKWFGVTEEDMAALEAHQGYGDAEREAKESRARYYDWLSEQMRKVLGP